MPEKLAAAAHEELEGLGVRILVGTRVREVDREGVLHLIASHGWLRGVLLIAVGRVNQVVRPRLKLH